MNPSWLCKCSHRVDQHKDIFGTPYECDFFWIADKFTITFKCDCSEFKLDNLKYLEQLYADRYPL